LIVPVKGGPAAKSRLRAWSTLATAIAGDTICAVVRCPRVADLTVVGGDGAWLRDLLADPRPEPRLHHVQDAGRGLNAAVRQGAGHLAHVAPDAPAAVLLGDLPALRPDSLTQALDAAGRALDGDPRLVQVFVPDAPGTGTVLLAARAPLLLRPRFGRSSAAEHGLDGALRLEVDLADLRRDVDTSDDLRAASRLGLGPRTRRAVEVLGADPPDGSGPDLGVPGALDLPEGVRTA
jgi:2-phospho-L-lactate guanylyltransferase